MSEPAPFKPISARTRRMTADRIIETLKQLGKPVTTLEVAAALDVRATALANRLSRLADYSLITREKRVDNINGRTTSYCLWSTHA